MRPRRVAGIHTRHETVPRPLVGREPCHGAQRVLFCASREFAFGLNRVAGLLQHSVGLECPGCPPFLADVLLLAPKADRQAR